MEGFVQSFIQSFIQGFVQVFPFVQQLFHVFFYFFPFPCGKFVFLPPREGGGRDARFAAERLQNALT